jgi:hypothetical protein
VIRPDTTITQVADTITTAVMAVRQSTIIIITIITTAVVV